jgi:hypothetical protein
MDGFDRFLALGCWTYFGEKMMFKPYIVAALISLATTNVAMSQTVGYADGISFLANACGADIQKLCKGINLGNDRLRSCLNQNLDKVSDQCKTGFTRAVESIQKRINAQASVVKICDSDISRLCGGVQPGDGNILECILLASKQVSPQCNRAVTDAGYR